jgi:oligosaccharide repeat unit polymerase
MDFSELISQLSMDSSDLYLEKQSRTVYTGGARNFLLWIPNTVASFTVLYNLCWFISLSVCKQSKIVNILLLLSSSISMLVGFASGGRAALLWWTLTFLVFYFFFKPNLSSKQVHAINIAFSIFAGIGLFGFIIITLSRFDDGANNALLSFIGYAGQQLNNFCALLPHIDLSHLYPDRLFPLSQYILTNEPLKLSEYYAFLSSIYPIQVNVFFTLFGELLMDTGIIGLLLFICLYTTIAISISRNRSIESYQLFVLAILFCIPVRGLFAWPFSNYFESLYLLFSVGLFIIFKYNLKFGQKHLL